MEGEGEGSPLVNPATGELLATASIAGVDLGAALRHARAAGGAALRALTFAQRAALLKGLAGTIHEHRDELLDIAMRNGGNTRGDAKFDIDGASGTLAYYADLGRELGDARVTSLDGDGVQLGRTPAFAGRHLLGARAAASRCSSTPSTSPPGGSRRRPPARCSPACRWSSSRRRAPRWWRTASSTPVGGGVLPGARHLRRRLAPATCSTPRRRQDVLAFTGRARRRAAARPNGWSSRGVRVNVEADSLNAAVLGPDVARAPRRRLFVRDVVREMTQKPARSARRPSAETRARARGAARARTRVALVERLAAVHFWPVFCVMSSATFDRTGCRPRPGVDVRRRARRR